MVYVTWRLDHVPFVSGSWDEGQRTTLTSYQDPIMDISLGENKDTFRFMVSNFNDEYTNFFKPQDKIYIYRVLNADTVNTATDLIMVGSVKNASDDSSPTVNRIKVEGYNYSETIARSMVFVDGNNRSIPVVLQDAVEGIANNSSFSITWSSGNPTLKTDGNAFPSITEKFYYKPLRDILEKYSQRQNTDDGTYYWYVNKDNELIWKPQNSATEHTFDLTTDVYRELKTDKDFSSIVNFVIIKGGLDPAGKPIQTKEIDFASRNKHGPKFKVLVPQTINAQSLNQADVLKSNGGDTNVTSKYPSYPFTTSWKSSTTETVETVSMVEGSAVTVNSDKQYVGVLRAHVLAQMKKEARAYIDAYKFGKLKVDIEFVPGQVSWGLGDNIVANIPNIGGSKILRVKQIQHTTSSDTYSLEEDVGTLT